MPRTSFLSNDILTALHSSNDWFASDKAAIMPPAFDYDCKPSGRRQLLRISTFYCLIYLLFRKLGNYARDIQICPCAISFVSSQYWLDPEEPLTVSPLYSWPSSKNLALL